MRTQARLIGAFLACAMAVLPGTAQTGENQDGIPSGPYIVRQSFEFGGHITDHSGNPFVWETFVNMRSGPRLLEQSFSMNAPAGQGVLFDNLSVMSFGYGGDPNAATRIRMARARWYNFTGSFRRSLNFWDYNLLANPLNPSTSNPILVLTNSPNRFHVARRMSNFDLMLAPQSPVRVRLGYGHNTSEGPTMTVVRAGTETGVLRGWRNTVHNWRAGVDFRFLPRTSISFDTFYSRYKGDNTWGSIEPGFQLSDGTPVDLGIIFNTASGQPCATPVADATTTPPTAAANCNAYLDFRRSQRARTSYPTQQLSFQSRYVRRLDIAGRVGYSTADSDMPESEDFFRGLATRTRQREFSVTGPAVVRRVSVNSDLGVTLHITDRFRVMNNFRWADYRIPGEWDMEQASLFGTSMLIAPNVFNPATCPADPSTCPQHASASGADFILQNFNRFLGQDAKTNTVELEYDFTRRIGARLGHRYRNRAIEIRVFDTADLVFFPLLPNRGACAGQPLDADGVCRVSTSSVHAENFVIREHSVLVGIWTRPTDALRIAFDVEAMSADHAFTRISPRHMQRYSLRTTYKPTPWMNVSSAILITERRNTQTDINHLQHNRNYSFSAILAPRDSFALDVSYSFHDFFSQGNICLVPIPVGSTSCGGAFLEQLSFYDADTHFVSTGVMWKPVPRVTANLGYTVNTSSGQTLILNPTAPLGPLDSTYHLPSGALAVGLAPRWTAKFGWNHYGYNERSDPGPTGSRNFRGNVFTLGMRYAF